MTLKNLLIEIGKFLLAVISTIFFGVTSIFLFQNKKQNNQKKTDENAATIKKNEVLNELKDKTADDIISSSNNAESVQSGIERQKEEFRARIRDRFNTKL